jgi:DNA-directed RNA polymerase specialized sigma24 family protein
VAAIAKAVWVRPQNRKFLEDVSQDVVLDALTSRAEDPNFLAEFDEIIPWVKRRVEAGVVRARKEIEDRPDQAAGIVTALQAPRDDTNPAAGLELEEFAAVIERTRATLPLAQRQVLDLIRGEHCTRAGAAQTLGRAENTVKNQLTSAIKHMTKGIQDYLASGPGQEPQP